MNMNSRWNQPAKGEPKKSVPKPHILELREYASKNLQAFALARELMTKNQVKEWRRRWALICNRPFDHVDIMPEFGRN